MTNQLPFWVLQHLYVIISLADIREIFDIKAVSEVFETLHPIVEALENQQERLKEKAQPLLKIRSDSQAKGETDTSVEEQIQELTDTHISLQNAIPDTFTWNDSQIQTIQETVSHVIKNLGTQNTSLSGWRRIDATNQIINFFDIKSSL